MEIPAFSPQAVPEQAVESAARAGASGDQIILFEDGLPGFEEIHGFRLYREYGSDVLWNLQAVDADAPSFVVVDPFALFGNYEPRLTPEDLAYFGRDSAKGLCFLCIAAIKPEVARSVVNLKAPVVIDAESRRARQIILEDDRYSIRHPLFENAG